MRARSSLPCQTRRCAHPNVGLALLLVLLSACNSGTTVMVATPAPPDAGFRTYRHPGGAFSLRLPPEWSVRDLSGEGGVRVEFSPPGNAGLPLSVWVTNTGQPLSASGLLEAVERYPQMLNNPAAYREMSRNAQGDGSWRLVGVRQTPIGPRQMNIFLQADGPFLTIVEADLTGLDPTELDRLTAIVNTLRVDTSASVAASGPPGALPGADAAVDSPAGVMEFSNVSAWLSQRGEFIVGGLVTNRSGRALEAIRITAALVDAHNNSLSEESNLAPLEVLVDGASSPFTVRFRGGRPAQAARYELGAAARYAEYALSGHLAADQFILGNDAATYNANGFLIVGGDVVNRTQGAAYFVKAVVTVYDDASQVVGADSVFVNDTELLPGEVGRFEVTFPELGGNAIRYTIDIEGKSTPGG